MPNVLLADDSHTQRHMLRLILESDPTIRVIAEARNGKEALEMSQRFSPDLIIMDLQMPVMDGYEAIRLIMGEHPRPILVLTDMDQAQVSFQALKLGALAVMPKPYDIDDPSITRLLNQIKSLAGMKVVRRSLLLQRMKDAAHPATDGPPPFKESPRAANHPPAPGVGPSQAASGGETPRVERSRWNDFVPRLVAIGVSTGGPPTLQTILSALPTDFTLPIAVVQHISPGFEIGLASWLSETTHLRCKVAEHGEALQPGSVYIAPPDRHLIIRQPTPSAACVAWLDDAPPIGPHRPSATALFESVARVLGPASIGLLLTGMGNDGASGLLALRQAGAYTIAQDQATSVVFGMPRVAIQLGAANEVLALHQIAPYLRQLTEPPTKAP